MNNTQKKYIFLIVSTLILSLSVWLVVQHYMKPNLTTLRIERNLAFDVDEINENPGLLVGQEEFEVKESDKVFVELFNGKNVSQLVNSGMVSILDEQDKTIFQIDVKNTLYKGEIKLAPGKYTVKEEMEPNIEAIKQLKEEVGDNPGKFEERYTRFSFKIYFLKPSVLR